MNGTAKDHRGSADNFKGARKEHTDEETESKVIDTNDRNENEKNSRRTLDLAAFGGTGGRCAVSRSLGRIFGGLNYERRPFCGSRRVGGVRRANKEHEGMVARDQSVSAPRSSSSR